MKKGDRYFNKKYWRLMIFLGETKDGKYLFEDFGDVRFTLTAEEVQKMEKR